MNAALRTMDKCNLLLMGPHSAAQAARFRERLGPVTEIETWVDEDGDDTLAARLAGADAIISMRWDSTYPEAPRLKLLQLPGAGYDRIDFDAVPDTATVCNVYEHEPAIAEYCLLAMLEHCISMRRMDDNLRQGDWSNSLFAQGQPHGELMGRTLGIVGFGHIGQAVAQRAAAFGTRIVAVTRHPEGKGSHLAWIGGMDRLDRLLAESDIVVLACALSDETHELIDAERLAEMKPDAFLINVARGALVDEKALYEALRAGRISGAAIDVWYQYPDPAGTAPILPSRLPFHKLDNVIMTPHAAGWTEQLMERRGAIMADNIRRLMSGEPLLNVLRAARA